MSGVRRLSLLTCDVKGLFSGLGQFTNINDSRGGTRRRKIEMDANIWPSYPGNNAMYKVNASLPEGLQLSDKSEK